MMDQWGGAITLPRKDKNSYSMNFTNNFFDGKYGRASYDDDAQTWLDLSSHEVGHIRDIKEIGGTAKYVSTFIAGYATAGSHDGNWREKRADGGRLTWRKS